MRSGTVAGKGYAFGLVSLPEKWAFPKSRLTVQLIAPEYVFGERHLLVSIYSHLKGLRLAKDPSIDLLLRIMGTTQIKGAVKAKPKCKAVLVVVGGGARAEYAKIARGLGAPDAGDVPSRKGEMDAAERSALAGLS